MDCLILKGENKMAKETKNINIENARIEFRNFSGREGKFNPEGNRHFSVLLEKELANILDNDGWNVRWMEPREEDADRQAVLEVAVRYNWSPPKILMITSQGKTLLTEETVKMLDWAEIESADVIIRPYHWEVGGKTGIKAYLQAMYVVIVEDAFEKKYNKIPFSGFEEKIELDDLGEPPFMVD